MAFEKVEYSFPDEEVKGEVRNTDIDVEGSNAVEIDISGKKVTDDYRDNKKKSNADADTNPARENPSNKDNIEIEVYGKTRTRSLHEKPRRRKQKIKR